MDLKIAMEKAMQADNVYSSFVTGPDDASRSTFTRANDGSYVIPVVVHVLHEDGVENISDEQITDAIEQANMQMAGGEGGFNVEIELRLARIDPDGNCTNGITRHLVDNSIVNLNQYDDLGNPDPDNYDPNALSDEEMKDIVRWPVDNYLNIWIVRCIEGNPDPGCGTNGGVAGYSYFPTVSDYLDGIVIKHKYFGNSGTAATNPVNTLVHEFGHYIYLYHVWGPDWYSIGQMCLYQCEDGGNCDTHGDRVCDTQRCKGPFMQIGGGCMPPYDNLCNECSNYDPASLYPVENYMSYLHVCQDRFTEGQAERMHWALETYRPNLFTISNLALTGVAFYNSDPVTISSTQIWNALNHPAGQTFIGTLQFNQESLGLSITT